MPRWPTDRFNLARVGNDAVYQEVDRAEKELSHEYVKSDESSAIKPRLPESMISEGQELRVVMERIISKAI